MNPRHNRDDPPSRVPKPDDGNSGGDATTPVIEIGPNHRRGITSTLVHLDETICLIEHVLGRHEARSELYSERNRLSESQKVDVLSEVAAIRDLLGEVRRKLDLEPVTRDVGAFISSHCMMLWESVIELQGRYLKRFGEAPGELTEFLDPKTEEIIYRLDQIVRLMGVFRRAGPTSECRE